MQTHFLRVLLVAAAAISGWQIEKSDKWRSLEVKIIISAVAFVACVIVGSFLVTPAPAFAQVGCGIVPIKPITPIGCKDLVAQCRCDSKGQNCHWEWVCVR